MFDNATRIMISGLMELEALDKTIRLCDGGMVNWVGRGLFVSQDPEYGTLGSVDASGEMIGDEQASGQLVINVPSVQAAVDLAVSEMQGRPLRFWLAEIDINTGAIVGTPEKLFDGVVDTSSISLERNHRTVTTDYVDSAERLFSIREGNVLSTRFHQTAWPGELGFDHCTGVGVQVPWGVSGPARGTINGTNGVTGSGLLARVFGGG